MRQTLLGIPVEQAKKRCRYYIGACVLLAVLGIVLNITLVVFRTDGNHSVLLFSNIAIDILVGWIITEICLRHIIFIKKLMKLSEKNTTQIVGIVDGISQTTKRYYGLDCLLVTVAKRQMFLPVDGAIILEEGTYYSFEVTSNLITGVTQ